MIIIYKGEEIAAEVPKELSRGDTIIIDGDVYEIYTKTYDFDKSCLYAQVELYKEVVYAIDIISNVYQSNDFTSSGFNTNSIEDNPRLMVALITIAAVVGERHMSRMGIVYRKNIIALWNQGSILWSDILIDNPAAACSDMEELKSICIPLLKNAKITPVVWPETLR